MTEIINLPDDFIGKEDERKLESFGGHLVGRGYATRWHWNRDQGVDVAFEIYRGGAKEELLASIRRDRDKDLFCAVDAAGRSIVEGSLEHVMAGVDGLASALHDQGPA